MPNFLVYQMMHDQLFLGCEVAPNCQRAIFYRQGFIFKWECDPYIYVSRYAPIRSSADRTAIL